MAYVSPIYEPNGAVKHFENTPRFGHSTDVNFLNGEEVVDYSFGLLFIPCFALSLTLLWLIVLAVLKCTCGDKFFSRNRIVRIIYLFSATAMFVTFILLMSFGNAAIKDTLDTLHELVEDLFAEFNKLPDATAMFATAVNNFYGQTRALQNDLSTFNCEAFPESLQGLVSTVVNSGALTDSRGNEYKEVIKQINLIDIEDALKQTRETSGDIIFLARDVLEIVFTAAGTTVFILVILFGIGCVLSWTGVMSKLCGAKIIRAMYSYFLLPLFVLVLILIAVAIGFTGALTLFSSDLCTGGGGSIRSPEGTVKRLRDGDLEFPPEVVDYVNYYIIEGCRSNNPNEMLSTIKTNIEGVSANVDSVLRESLVFFDDTANQEICPGLTEVPNFLIVANTTFTSAIGAMTKAIQITRCEFINGIFVSLFHDGVCNDFSNALHLIFGLFYTFLILGLIMLTTHGAFHPDEGYENIEQLS